MKLKVLGLVGTLAVCNGCMSMSSMQTARVLTDGKGEANVEAGYFSMKSFVKDGDSSISLPYFGGGYRRGFGNNIDAGLKYVLPGTISADGKYQFVDTPEFAMATGVGVGYFSLESKSGDAKTSSTAIDLSIPLHTSYDINESFALYLTPKYTARMVSNKSSGYSESDLNKSSSDTRSLMGASVGTKIGKDSGVYLEMTYTQDLTASEPIMPALSMPVAIALKLEKFSLKKAVAIAFTVIGIWLLI